MIFVITESSVKQYKSMKRLQAELSLEQHELTQIGKDYVVNMTDDSFEVAKDIKLLEAVASKKVFTKESMDLTNWLQVITMITVFFMLTKG